MGVRAILRYLGHAMTRANRDAESVGTVEARLYKKEADTLREPLERVPRWRVSMRGFLADLAESTGILGPHDGPEGDWRFWHRTFREELAAEELEQRVCEQGLDAVLTHAQEVAGDEGRWAEPYALLTGRVAEPDRLVQALIKANRALGLRALATAQEPGPDSGRFERMVRGSCFWYGADWARSAFRISRNAWLETNTRGFRVVLPGPLEPP